MPLRVGFIVGIAASDAAVGDTVDLVTIGVFDLPKVVPFAHSVGDIVYWGASGDTAVNISGDDRIRLGATIEAADANDTHVRVRLNGSF